MRTITVLLWSCLAMGVVPQVAQALTLQLPVTRAYVQEHQNEWSVEVKKGEDGLIHFTIQHDVGTAMYHVAHLAVRHHGQLMATSDTPSFGKKRGNTFYFSLAPEDIGESKFELSDSALSGSGEEAAPVMGAMIYQFKLLDFVPERLLQPSSSK